MCDDLRKRFFEKIAPHPSSDCIMWVAAARPAGYGLIHFDGRLVSATHVSWFLKHGCWPTQHILHRCDNPGCVNPEHLFEGSDADNAADRVDKGRSNTPAGFDVGGAKLEHFDVCEILALTDTRMTNAEIGALFGVGAAYVSSLRHGRWRTLPQGRGSKPKGCRRYVVAGQELTIDEIARRAGVSRATIEARIKGGASGDALLAEKHKAPRKPYVRRR